MLCLVITAMVTGSNFVSTGVGCIVLPAGFPKDVRHVYHTDTMQSGACRGTSPGVSCPLNSSVCAELLPGLCNHVSAYGPAQ